jgi:hypothetical protein
MERRASEVQILEAATSAADAEAAIDADICAREREGSTAVTSGGAERAVSRTTAIPKSAMMS